MNHLEFGAIESHNAIDRTAGETVTISIVAGYSHYASYLINGDSSALSDNDKKDADEFSKYCSGEIVSTQGEEYFGRPDNGGLQGDIVDYIVHENS